MNQVDLEYDPVRGGFTLRLPGEPGTIATKLQLFGGILDISLDSDGFIHELNSFWDRGGMPLNGLHLAFPSRNVSIPFTAPQKNRSMALVKVYADSGLLAAWFPNPLLCALTFQEATSGLELWLSEERVSAGSPTPREFNGPGSPLVLGFRFPLVPELRNGVLTQLNLSPEDFK